jgi:beta-glucosidase
VNGKSIQQYNNWRTLPSRVPLKVEKGKKYTIEIRFAQLNNWAANLEFNFGKEVDVDYTDLLNKLGLMLLYLPVDFPHFWKEEMPVSYPGFKGGDRTDIELPEVQRNCLKL